MSRSSVCLCCNSWNETDNIVPWVEAGVSAGCTCVAVLDTGGTDDTLAKVRDTCERLAVPCYTQYLDMNADPSGASRRNRVLEIARTTGATYLLWCDADDRVVGQIPANLTEPAYMLPVKHGAFQTRRAHLVRCDVPCDWGSMPRHEVLDVGATQVLPMVWVEEGDHRPDRRGGFAEDARILAAHVAEHPDDCRAVFYTARSYHDSGDVFKAIEWYQNRIRMGTGYWAEIAYSWYCLGLLNTSWAHQLESMLNAIQWDPARLEPYWQMTYMCRSRGWNNIAQMWLDAGVKAAAGPDSLGLFICVGAREGLATEWRALYGTESPEVLG